MTATIAEGSRTRRAEGDFGSSSELKSWWLTESPFCEFGVSLETYWTSKLTVILGVSLFMMFPLISFNLDSSTLLLLTLL